MSQSTADGELGVPSDNRDQQTSQRGQGATRGKPQVLIAPTTPQMTDETSQFLRQRLRAVALVLTVALSITMFGELLNRDLPTLWLRISILAIIAGCCGLLFSRLPMTLRQLRLLELTLVLAIGTQLVIVESILMTRLAAMGEVADMVSVGIVNSLAWSLVILIYGIFMPNTWVRAALILIPAACVPYAVMLFIDWQNQQVAFVREIHLVVSTPMPILAAFIAIYAAHVIQSARRDAFEARQLGHYRLKDKLGSGAFGEVYEAEHLLLKRPSAVKLIRSEYVADSKALARFEREVKAIAKLSHWNTIEIYDFGQTADGTFYYMMELLDGLNLGQIVDGFGPLPPGRAVHFLRQTCNALNEAHAAGLVHRDIKPANIFAARVGGICDVVKLLDFGLVRETKTSDNPALTGIGMIVGTSLYMSPEQAVASGYATARADIYSVGAVAYFLVTGQPPFVREDISQALLAHAQEEVNPPSRLRSDLPRDLEEIILRCLEKKPGDRYQSAADLDKALAECRCADEWLPDQAEEWWRRNVSSNSRPSESRG